MWTKRAVVLLCVAACALGVGGCGFQLRGDNDVGDGLRGATVYTVNVPKPLARALERTLAEQNATVTATADAADVVLHVLDTDYRRDTAVLDNSGKVAAYRLSYVVRFRLSTAAQDVKLIPAKQITVVRHLDYAAGRVLQSENEEDFTREKMILEAAQRIARRAGRVAEVTR